jgi:TIR domain
VALFENGELKMDNFHYFCFKLDYSKRTLEIPFIKNILKNFTKNEVTNIGIAVNNNIYSLELYLFLYIEGEQVRDRFVKWINVHYKSKKMVYNKPMSQLTSLNIANFIDCNSVDFIITKQSNWIFIFPEKEFFENKHPQYNETKHEDAVVFLSHSSLDKEDIVEPLFDYLQSKELPIWLDKYQIDYGENIYQKISDGIDKAKLAVFILTENFLNSSKWGKEELGSLTDLILNDKSLVINAISDSSKIPRMLKARKYISWDDGNNLKEIADVIERKLKKHD